VGYVLSLTLLSPWARDLLQKRGMSQAWWCMPEIPAFESLKQESCKFKASLSHMARSVSPYKGLGYSSMVECLPSKSKALGSITNNGKKKK
jgi:hypothetical protein